MGIIPTLLAGMSTRQYQSLVDEAAAFGRANRNGTVGEYLVDKIGQVRQSVSSAKAAINNINRYAMQTPPSSAEPHLPSLSPILSRVSESSPGVSYVSAGSGTSVPVPDYVHADLAKAYGMDASTAYQEALSNTSYQRSIDDMRAAGLNPAVMFGAGASGASTSVYGASPYTAQVQGAGLSSGVSSGKSLHTWYNVMSNIGSIASAFSPKPYVTKGVFSAFGNVMDYMLNG